jgi:FkbM family methyltransferase
VRRVELGEFKIRSLLRYLSAALRPVFWPAIARGVMPSIEHTKALSSLGARTVLDVGANKGQFSLIARYLFPAAEIYAFEPLESARRVYQSVVSGPIKVHAVALGAETGKAKYFIASRADSSSLFLPGKRQELAYGVVLSSTTTVNVETLEAVIEPSALVAPVLLKLDVQGGELDVLKGAEKLLPHVDAIYCEVSFVELYERQPLASAIVSFLSDHNFKLRGVFNLSVTKHFGATQADLLFVRGPNSCDEVRPNVRLEFDVEAEPVRSN